MANSVPGTFQVPGTCYCCQKCFLPSVSYKIINIRNVPGTFKVPGTVRVSMDIQPID